MSTEVTRLDCVRGASVEDATEAIVALLASRGFSLLPPDGDEGDAPRRLALYLEGRWLVVVDEDRFSEDPCWAAELSRALGGPGIALKAYSDFDSVTLVRFDGGQEVSRFVLGQDTRREEDEWLRIKLPFLADLAPVASRPSLERGLEVGRSADEIALAIAEAAGLPRPLDKYALPPGHATQLSFVMKCAPVKMALPIASPPQQAEAERHRAEREPEPTPFDDASADELAAFGSFLVGLEQEPPEAVEARQVRVAVQERPPLPGRMEDGAALDNYLGRAWAVGRAQWDGDFAELEEELVAILSELAAGMVDNFGDDVIGVELRPRGRSAPVRVGGPLAASTSPRGASIWQKIRPHLAGGASLSFRGADLHFEHAPRTPTATSTAPCAVLLEWSVPVPPHEPMVRALSSCFDSVVRRCARSPHVAEALVVSQERPGELAYPRMTGLWGIRDRRWWPAHVTGPGWRVFVPTVAARKLRDDRLEDFAFDEYPSGLLVASKAPSPFATTAAEMNRLAGYLLPAIGTNAERDTLNTAE